MKIRTTNLQQTKIRLVQRLLMSNFTLCFKHLMHRAHNQPPLTQVAAQVCTLTFLDRVMASSTTETRELEVRGILCTFLADSLNFPERKT